MRKTASATASVAPRTLASEHPRGSSAMRGIKLAFMLAVATAGAAQAEDISWHPRPWVDKTEGAYLILHAIDWSQTRYIARNPVEAGLCAAEHEWPWSSHGMLAAGRAPAWLDAQRAKDLGHA